MAAGGEGSSTANLDPWTPVRDAVLGALASRLSSPAQPVPRETLERLLDSDGGPDWDLAVPLHRFGKALGAPPPELARRLAETLPPLEAVARVEPKGPYLNFQVDRAWMTDRTLHLVRERGDAYGGGPTAPVRVCVEHTSANPNGPFHIGRVRNAILGDSFARVLRRAGFPVTTHYYVDDVGRQAAMLTWIWSKPVEQWPEEVKATLEGANPGGEKPDHYLGRPYPAVNEYLKGHPEANAEVQALTHALEGGRRNEAHRDLVQKVLDGMVASLGALGVRFDRFVWESDLVQDGSVARVVEKLTRATNAVREPNGAWAIDATGAGLPQDSSKIIVTRGDGSSLYATRDVAYHLQKFAEFDRVVDVLGANHLLHAQVLRALLAAVGETRAPETVLYQYITAAEGGGMSTRRGTAVYLDDLFEEAVERARAEIHQRREDLTPEEVEAIAGAVAAGAIRYHILRVAADKTVAFRWEDALSFEGRSGPFVQYAYARAASILRKSGETPSAGAGRAADLTTPEEWALVRQVSRFPGLVTYVARTAHVHALAGYAHTLAEEFNRFYQQVPVLKAGDERASRLALVGAFRQTLGNCLELLGLEALERM